MKATKESVVALEDRLERRFKLIFRDLDIKDKKIARVRREVKNISSGNNGDNNSGYPSGDNTEEPAH